ncbi:hypothetical protein N4Q63_27150, partial [Leclercia adecarboxylata]|uniref:hypothetical protein n=1 Tax=Leclercia adecarboxylata TaxID=83655 RepID=UPI00234CDD2E|nr:hypothetical protein [Leclercia adecarboxylata]
INELLDAEWQLEAVFNAEQEQIQSYIAKQISQIKHLASKAQAVPKFALILSELENAYTYLSHHSEKSRDTDIQAALLAGHCQLVGLFDALAGSTSLRIDEQVIEQLKNIAQSEDSNSNSNAGTVGHTDIDKEAEEEAKGT